MCDGNWNDSYCTTLDVGNSALGFSGPRFLKLGIFVETGK